MNDMVCVRYWFLFVLAICFFLFGYFGDIFMDREKKKEK